jgi:hypothetical protein
MTTALHRETAKIYQFPAGGRAAFNPGRRINQAAEAASSVRPSKVVYGGSWYHEAAIQDVDPARKR